MELARRGVDVSNKTLKRGIVIPNRTERFTDATDPPSYPNRGDFLMGNPFKKQKKNKKKKGGPDSPLRKRGKSKSKSPTKRKEERASDGYSVQSNEDLEGDGGNDDSPDKASPLY